MILLLALANLTNNGKLAVPGWFRSQRNPRLEDVVHLAPGHFAVLGRRGSCKIVTELVGLHKRSMVLMQRYGTVCSEGLSTGDFLKMVGSTGLSGSCGSLAMHAQPAFFSAYWFVQLLSRAAFPSQSLTIWGEPQGIQWQLNMFLWTDFKASFPLSPSWRGSEGRRGKEEVLHVTLLYLAEHGPFSWTTRNSSWL